MVRRPAAPAPATPDLAAPDLDAPDLDAPDLDAPDPGVIRVVMGAELSTLVAYPAITDLLDFHQRLRGGRDEPPPSRERFTMFTLRRWLGWLMILDPVDGGADFAYRLHGTRIVGATGVDMTGRRLSAQRGPGAAFMLAVHRRVLREQAPCFVETTADMEDIPQPTWQRLALPVTNAGAPQIIACAYLVQQLG